MTTLFTPLQTGSLLLPNRAMMAPMTRGRATSDGVPTEAMQSYYAARSDAGLLISEGICVSAAARGWTGAPSLYTDAQIAGWKGVTDAVHDRHGRICAQLWYLGRVSHPLFLDGATPWAPSPIAPAAHVHAPSGETFACVTPHEMTHEDIRSAIADFADGARRAVDAGFDCVEIHAANGYLPDQFLRDKTNRRTDAYGGTPARRSRFILETVEACAAAIGPDRVAIRLSPRNRYNDIDDSDPEATFGTLTEGLAGFGLAFLEVMEGLPGHFLHVPAPPLLPQLKAIFNGPVVANGGYDRASAERTIAAGEADAISFGVPFIANPDLVARLKSDAPLNAPDPATFYTAGEPGYLSYPTLAESPEPPEAYRPISLEDARKH